MFEADFAFGVGEGGFPILQGVGVGDELGEVHLAFTGHCEGAVPGGPVGGDCSLNAELLVDDATPIDFEGVVDQGDLYEAAAVCGCVETLVDRSTCPTTVEDDVGAVSVAHLQDELDNVGFLDVDRFGNAKGSGVNQAIAICARARNDDTGPSLKSEPGTHQADGAGPADESDVAG